MGHFQNNVLAMGFLKEINSFLTTCTNAVFSEIPHMNMVFNI
jgi:hypothetical protein